MNSWRLTALDWHFPQLWVDGSLSIGGIPHQAILMGDFQWYTMLYPFRHIHRIPQAWCKVPRYSPVGMMPVPLAAWVEDCCLVFNVDPSPQQKEKNEIVTRK